MIYFSPTPRGMSRTLTKWLALHGAGQVCELADAFKQTSDNQSMQYIMYRHHPKLATVLPKFEQLHKTEIRTFGIVRNPLNRVWSAFIRFGKQNESFDDFWLRWQAFAPTDQDMLDGANLILKFEDGRDEIWEAVRNFTNIDGPTKIINDAHKRSQPKQNYTSNQIQNIKAHYHWTYTNFDY